MKISCTGTLAVFLGKRHDMVIEYPLSMLEGKARVLENGTINDFDNASGKLYRRISLSSFFFFHSAQPLRLFFPFFSENFNSHD